MTEAASHTSYRDADARFVGRMMLLGGSWANRWEPLIADRDLVREIADLEDEYLITGTRVQAILARHGYPQHLPDTPAGAA